MSLIVSSLDKSIHKRNSFDCGVKALNHYIQKQALQHDKRHVSRTYVLSDTDKPDQILGFYTVSNCQISRNDLDEIDTKFLPYHPIPAVVIGRLAVDDRYQGSGYGKYLLVDAIQRCARVSLEVGVYAIVVDAKDENAKTFYQKYGFKQLPEYPLKLLLPMKTAIELLDSQ